LRGKSATPNLTIYFQEITPEKSNCQTSVDSSATSYEEALKIERHDSLRRKLLWMLNIKEHVQQSIPSGIDPSV
jgi:hypothetical protein